MIDADKLEAQRRAVEAMRLEAERAELRNRLRAAELEAVRLGLRLECSRGCGREVGQRAASDVCVACRKAESMRRSRQRPGLAVVS